MSSLSLTGSWLSPPRAGSVEDMDRIYPITGYRAVYFQVLFLQIVPMGGVLVDGLKVSVWFLWGVTGSRWLSLHGSSITKSSSAVRGFLLYACQICLVPLLFRRHYRIMISAKKFFNSHICTCICNQISKVPFDLPHLLYRIAKPRLHTVGRSYCLMDVYYQHIACITEWGSAKCYFHSSAISRWFQCR